MPNIIISLFIALALLPYVQIIPTGTDTQPNAFILAALILAESLGAVRLNRVQALPWLLPPIALAVFLVEVVGAGTGLLQNLRSLYNYIALPVISTVVVLHYRSVRRRILPIMNGVNLIYFVVGLAQVATGSQLVGRLVGGGDRVDSYSFSYRGAVGLAPEPTYYATVMLLFILLYACLGKERSKWTALALVQILFFSRSTMVILFIGVLVLLRAIFARRFKTIAVGGACAVILFAAVMNLDYFAQSRVRSIAEMIQQDPSEVINRDPSISGRIGSAWYSCTGVFENYGLPNGFSTFFDYYSQKMAANGTMTDQFRAGMDAIRSSWRINSGMGSVLWELGIFGALVPIGLILIVRNYFGSITSDEAINAIVGLVLVLLSGIPIGFPIIGLIWGLLAGGKWTGYAKRAPVRTRLSLPVRVPPLPSRVPARLGSN
jgi:hypothetical protein